MKVGVVGNPRYRDLKAVLEHVAQIAPAKGITLYCEERLGPFWGYLAGWGFVVGKTASCAAIALTFAAYVAPGQPRLVAA